jgi:hypothetical protein
MTVGDAIGIFRQRLDAKQDIKEGAKVYRRKCIEALLKSWPELEQKPVGKVSKEECLEWSRKLAAKYSASVYNNTVGHFEDDSGGGHRKGGAGAQPR